MILNTVDNVIPSPSRSSGNLLENPTYFLNQDFIISGDLPKLIEIKPKLCQTNIDGYFMFSCIHFTQKFSDNYITALNCLSPQSKKIAKDPNAGGNSVWSEVYSFEIMKRLFNAELILTEMGIEYYPYCSKKTDYVCQINNEIFGISVTRAMKYNGEFNYDDAQILLYKKLMGIRESTKNVILKRKWIRQILHVWTPNETISQIIIDCFKDIPSTIRTNTILIVSETSSVNGEFIFKNLNYLKEHIDKYIL